MLSSLNDLSAEQASPMENTLKKLEYLLHYAATFPNAVFRFKGNDIALHVDSDAAYLILP